MREIKFRAFENGTMYRQVRCGGLFNGIPTAPTTWNEEKGDWLNLTGQPHTIVMQYTGVKDDDGNEIYEGDIVRVSCALIAPQSIDIKGEVKMLEGGWVVDSGSTLRNLWSEVHNVQIIGNIYEGLRK